MKRYCKVTFYVFLIKNIFDDDKKINLYDRLFVLDLNFTTEYFKNSIFLLKIPGIFRFFSCFSKISGKVATLNSKKKLKNTVKILKMCFLIKNFFVMTTKSYLYIDFFV